MDSRAGSGLIMMKGKQMRKRLMGIPGKMRSRLRGDRQPMSLKYAFWSFISSVAAILAAYAVADMVGYTLFIAPLGASAVLLFGANDSPLAQPRNLIGGHLISACVAAAIVALLGSSQLTMALAVGLSILLMNLTHTTHPPGGATALIGVQGHAGITFIFVPVLAGALILLAAALFTNNLAYHRQYPRHWL